MIFRQLFDAQSSSYTYLLADAATRQAVLIDPVFEHARRDAALVEELGLKLCWTLETHVHADHVTGAWLLKRRLGSMIGLCARSGAQGADRELEDGETVGFGRRALEVRCTPGHTNGCVTYVLDDQSMAFTGDCLLIRGSGRADFQQGDARVLYRSVHAQIFTLPAACLLYPGHDYRGLTATSVGLTARVLGAVQANMTGKAALDAGKAAGWGTIASARSAGCPSRWISRRSSRPHACCTKVPGWRSGMWRSASSSNASPAPCIR